MTTNSSKHPNASGDNKASSAGSLKILSLLVLVSLCPVAAQAQWVSSGGNTTTTDNVGIGTSPSSGNKLTVEGAMSLNGDLTITKSSPSAFRNIMAKTTLGGLQLAANTGSGNGSSIEMYSSNSSGREGELRFISYGPAATGGGIQFLNYDPGATWKTNMKILSSGLVVIGDVPIPSSNTYGLLVDRGILTEKVRVAIKGSSEWADFVFDEKYRLMPLKELECFIEKEKHLPGIPTTEQVMKEGVDVGKMQAQLLQKVEELTRYIIMQQKEIEELKQKQPSRQ